MFQGKSSFSTNSRSYERNQSVLNGKGWLGGIIFAVVAGSIIIGGIKSIGKVTEKLVPIMAFIYVFSCLFIIFTKCSFNSKQPYTVFF